MIYLTQTKDYVFVFAVVAILGAIGGLVYELLITVRKESGSLTMPWRDVHAKPPRAYLGFFASILIGAVAAIAALWLFPPTVTNTIVRGVTKSVTSYDPVKLVAIALIVGSAGRSAMTALQSQAIAIVKSNEAANTKAVAKAQLKVIKTESTTTKAAASVHTAIDMAIKALDATDSN